MSFAELAWEFVEGAGRDACEQSARLRLARRGYEGPERRRRAAHVGALLVGQDHARRIGVRWIVGNMVPVVLVGAASVALNTRADMESAPTHPSQMVEVSPHAQQGEVRPADTANTTVTAFP